MNSKPFDLEEQAPDGDEMQECAICGEKITNENESLEYVPWDGPLCCACAHSIDQE